MKIAVLLTLCLCISVFVFFKTQLFHGLTLDDLKSQYEILLIYYKKYTLFTYLLYFIIYGLSATIGLPILTLLTIGAGALFGLIKGTLIISFSSSIAATLTFLISRFFLFEKVQSKFKKKLKTFYQMIEKEGGFYLFSLRLTPIFPFFLVNVAMGLTPIRTLNFYLISQIGMLPITFLYVYTGTQLKEINSTDDLISLKIISLLTVLALSPLITKFYFSKRSQKHHSLTS